MNDDEMRGAADVYGFVLREIMNGAISDGFWFDASKGDQISWLDINWEDSKEELHHRKVIGD